jgi:transposase
MYLFVGIGGACVIIACSISVVKFSTMPRPYSNDLRWRMIYQRYFYNRSYEDIASQLFVCSKTVYRTVRTFLNTGDVKPCRLGYPTGSITLFPHEEYIIMDCILRNLQMQLHEVADNIANATGSAFGPGTLCRALYRLGITRKKVRCDIFNKLVWLCHNTHVVSPCRPMNNV